MLTAGLTDAQVSTLSLRTSSSSTIQDDNNQQCGHEGSEVADIPSASASPTQTGHGDGESTLTPSPSSSPPGDVQDVTTTPTPSPSPSATPANGVRGISTPLSGCTPSSSLRVIGILV